MKLKVFIFLFVTQMAWAESLSLFNTLEDSSPRQQGWAYTSQDKVFIITPENSELGSALWTEWRGKRHPIRLYLAQPLQGYQLYEFTAADSSNFETWDQYRQRLLLQTRSKTLVSTNNSGRALTHPASRHTYLPSAKIIEALFDKAIQASDLGATVRTDGAQLVGFLANQVYLERPNASTWIAPLQRFAGKTRRIGIMNWAHLEEPSALNSALTARSDTSGWWVSLGPVEAREHCNWELIDAPPGGPIGGADGWGIGGADGWGIGGSINQGVCRVLIQRKVQAKGVFEHREELLTRFHSLVPEGAQSVAELEVVVPSAAEASQSFVFRPWRGLSDFVTGLESKDSNRRFPIRTSTHSQCQIRLRKAAQNLTALLREEFPRLDRIHHKLAFVHLSLAARLAETQEWPLLKETRVFDVPRETASWFWMDELRAGLRRQLESEIYTIRSEARDCK
jgi:hypothetical protein